MRMEDSDAEVRDRNVPNRAIDDASTAGTKVVALLAASLDQQLAVAKTSAARAELALKKAFMALLPAPKEELLALFGVDVTSAFDAARREGLR